MNVPAFLGLAVFFLATAPAVLFDIPKVGMALAAPAGWEHNAKDEFGYVIMPPEDQQSPNRGRKLRLHVTSSEAEDLTKQLELGVDRVTEKSPKGGSADRKHFLGAAPVRTVGGIEGVKGAFGTREEDGSIRTTIDKYYFKNEAGKIICVCAYVYGPPELAAEYERIILEGLMYWPAQGK